MATRRCGALSLQPRPPLTGVSRALRARNPERVSKESKNSLRSLKIDCFETPETVSRLFRALFGPRGRKAPGDSLETLSGFRARRARETPVTGGRGCGALSFRRATLWKASFHLLDTYGAQQELIDGIEPSHPRPIRGITKEAGSQVKKT